MYNSNARATALNYLWLSSLTHRKDKSMDPVKFFEFNSFVWFDDYLNCWIDETEAFKAERAQWA